MSVIKQTLLAKLTEDDWSRKTVVTQDIGWWADEHWLIQSTREQWATEVYINFIIVEPVWDAPRMEGDRVAVVTATAKLPGSQSEAFSAIAKIDLQKSIDKQIMPFVYALNYYRRTQCIDV